LQRSGAKRYDCVSLRFDVAGKDLADEYRFVQGQHLTLRACSTARNAALVFDLLRSRRPANLCVAVKKVGAAAFGLG
jgi:ring-1,2-phenylacetyl-CoA epoxidase subunit PaaE